MSKTRLSIEVNDEVAKFLEQIAEDEGATKTEMVRRALSVLKAYRQQKDKGRNHIGFVEDSGKLDAELVGILD